MALASSSPSRGSRINCLSQPPEEMENADTNQTTVPIIALVNGLSGGHKGEKVQRLLLQQNIHAFDLLKLSKDEEYFRSFVAEISAIFNTVVKEELKRAKDKTDKNWQLHPRILIGGGDGTIAWALSVLDRALLHDDVLSVFWQRWEALQTLREEEEQNKKDAPANSIIAPLQKSATYLEKLAENMTISDEFYYANGSNATTSDIDIMPYPFLVLDPLSTVSAAPNGITPFNSNTNAAAAATAPTVPTVYDFGQNNNNDNEHDPSDRNIGDQNDKSDLAPPSTQTPEPQQPVRQVPNKTESIAMMEQNVDDVLLHKQALKVIIDDEQEEEEADCESSASLSAQDESRIMEEFMNSPKISPLFNDQSAEEEQKYDVDVGVASNQGEQKQDTPVAEEEGISELPSPAKLLKNDSFSESLVTREELHILRISKEAESRHSIRTSYDELRVLQAIYDTRIAPAIVLVPLGTGNDLSRCLGTGTTYPGSKELITNLIPNDYTKPDAPITKLDRWRIQFVDTTGAEKERQVSEMLCYFSVGFEGQIAYRFAEARKKNPALFDRPWKNKIQYILSGIGAGVEEAFNITKPLNNVIDVFVDGVKLKLPSKTRSLVVSNINSMADGVYFWGNGTATKKDINATEHKEPRLGDGKVEVMAAKGIYKYLQMRMGMSHYRRMAQPKTVTIIMKNELPIQVDGESWIESPGIVQIYLLHQVHAIVGKNEPRGIRIV